MMKRISTAPAQEVNTRNDGDDRRVIAMRKKLPNAVLTLVALLVLPGLAWSQDAPQTLAITGQPGQIPILHVNGKSYVDIDSLARLTNSSQTVKGNQVILTPSGSATSTTTTAPEPSATGGQLKLVSATARPRIPSPQTHPRRQSQPLLTKRPRLTNRKSPRLRHWPRPRRIPLPTSSAFHSRTTPTLA